MPPRFLGQWLLPLHGAALRVEVVAQGVGVQAGGQGQVGQRDRLPLGLEGGDDVIQVAGDLPVHLGDAGMPVRLGRGDDLQGGLPLGVMLREELRGSHEHRAGQTRVRMRAGFDQGQLAVAVRERLLGARDVESRLLDFQVRAAAFSREPLSANWAAHSQMPNNKKPAYR